MQTSSLRKLLTFALCLAALMCAGCDDSTPSRCEANNATLKANAEAQRAQSEVQLEVQRRMLTLQMEVAKRCADKGNIPILLNGNVDCKPVAK